MKNCWLGLILIVFAAAAGCATGSNYDTGGWYTDQDALTCKHNPYFDGIRIKNKKYGLFIAKEIYENDSLPEINTRINSAVQRYNVYGMIVDDFNALKTKAAKKGVSAAVKSIAAKYAETQQCPELELQKLGERLGYDNILFVDIANVSSTVTVATVNFENSNLQVLEMQRIGQADITIRIIDVKGKKGVMPGDGNEALLLMSEPVVRQYTTSYNYDTVETYAAKRNMVMMENARRRAQNEADKARMESERIEAENSKDNVGILLNVLGDVLYTEMPMLNLSFEFNRPKYIRDKDFFNEIYDGVVSSGFDSYYARIDGKSIEGNTINGVGSFQFRNGDVYIGEWKEGAANGKGEYKYADGRIYKGEFSEGAAEGAGLYIDASGYVYEGQYSAGMKNGTGSYKRGNKVYQAECTDGEYRGLTNPADPNEKELSIKRSGEILNITQFKKRTANGTGYNPSGQ